MEVKSLYPIIVCNDVDASAKFYSDAMGFTVKHSVATKIGSKIIVMANASGQQFELMQATGNSPIKPGFYGMRMNVADIKTAQNELKAAGCTVLADPVETELGYVLPVVDPNGVKITIIQHVKKDK